MNNKIAIVGMSALFPGSETLEGFWQNLMDKKDLTGLANTNDFGVEPSLYFNDKKGIVDRCYSLRGGFIRDFKFNPQGYKLASEQLQDLDMLYQWALHVSKDALLHAGYADKPAARNKCGVILGNLSFPTGSTHRLLSSIYTDTLQEGIKDLLGDKQLNIASAQLPIPNNDALQGDAAQLVKRALGLQGTALDLDAACASSLYAIKLACDELLANKADMMLAGAVCGSDQFFIHMGFSMFHAYAVASDIFVPFDKKSGGLVSSEGAGVIVLKRLADAERDGDNILGVISGIGLSNDGKGKFLLSPNPKGQIMAFERAYKSSPAVPEETTYIECHATGTPLGDITEINSIETFFSNFGNKPKLGSVKSNMGHLLTAAGMTGLFKVLLAMDKQVIPPNINMTEAIDTDKGWLTGEQIIMDNTPWQDTLKQAAINSFGFGGTNAHMVVENHAKAKQQVETPNVVTPLVPLAITGMDAHFGNCTTLEDFYQTIYDNKQHFRALPTQRWKGFEANEGLLKKYGFKDGKAPKGNYIEDFEIDLLRYKIQPKEAETLEVQQALILKVADNAIKNANLKEGQNVAVIIAMQPELSIHHYLARWDVEWQLNEVLKNAEVKLTNAEKEELIATCKNILYQREGDQTPSQHTSFVGNIMASRLAALWDFTGPAFTITNGDDSVLRAIEVAQNMLTNGEVDAVVVGGVDFSGGLEHVLLNNQKHAVNSATNPSLSINDQDNGWLIGEGAGAIVLKNANLVPKNELVYAVIDQISSELNTQDIDYCELHATGFAEADQKEMADLLAQQPNRAVALGSVKSNIGHTFSASGIASVIKTALCLHYKFIPGIPNWNAPKQESDFAKSNYYFPSNARPWVKNKANEVRKALVYGASEQKIQMKESVQSPNPAAWRLQQFSPKLFVLKGNSEKELTLQLNALEVALESGEVTLSALSQQFYTKTLGTKYDYCIALIAESAPALSQDIKRFKAMLPNAFAQGKVIQTPQGSYFNPVPTSKTGQLAFVYPGSATAYEGLGAEIFQLFPDLFPYYEQKIDSITPFIAGEYLYPRKVSANSVQRPIQTDAIAMMSVGVFFSTVYTHVLRAHFGVQPAAAMGYSMGECSSMFYSLGVWKASEADLFQQSPIFKNHFAGNLELLCELWKINTEEAKARWVSLILLANKDKVMPLLEGKDKVYLTFINTDNEVIISGDRSVCYEIAAQLGCINVEVPFQNVIHHDFCVAEDEGLLAMHNFTLQERPAIDFYSSITLGKLPMDSLAIAKNSTQVCYEKVDFPQFIRAVYAQNVNTFIEIGANSTCSNWIKDILKTENHAAVSFDKKGVSLSQTLLMTLGQILSNGFEADLSILFEKGASEKPAKTFMKKIKPGGARVYDVLLDEQYKIKYADVPRKQHQLVAAEIHSHTDIIPIESLPNYYNNDHNLIQHTTPMADTTMLEKAIKLGENGLPLHDFSTGEHLAGKTIIFSQEDLEEFATGKISKVFGPDYAIIDTYKRRVMLPMHPYLLVSRVTGLNAKMGEFKPSTMQTEYDIPYNSWYSTDGQIPWAVSVESGQCDLLLISYLGIDFQAKGDYVYRLLDCTLTFLDDLPLEGQTLRYDISINNYVRNGNNLLFFFSYECFVEDRMVLKMDGGCAGFFRDDQLADGAGVVYTNAELEALKNVQKRTFTPLLRTAKRAFSKEDLRHLINGDIEKCFDDIAYFANGRNPSLRLPDERILMIDRITSVDMRGGAYGLGEIIAEKDLSPDDWFFPCHFRDDEVLAGSLQAEGGGNLLRFFMLMLGLQRVMKDARFQPVCNIKQKVRCRKQVTPTADTKLIYKLTIKEIGVMPEPYVIGDLEIISNGVITVHFENLGLQLREKSNPRYLNQRSVYEASEKSVGALMNESQISTFALGRLSDCFGPEFSVYDHRETSRQPNTDLQLISRVLKVEGERGNFSKPSTIYAEYDVPQDAWYYTQNATPAMPYSIMMEIALQPCGLVGAYLGSTLKFPDQDLYLRNLDGEGEYFDLPKGTDFRGKTILNKSVLMSSISLGGVIIQKYTYDLTIDGHLIYKGNSSFGFFTKEALASQAGLDNSTAVAPWYQTQGLTAKDYFQFKLDSLYAKMKLFKGEANKPLLHLSGDQLLLIDGGLIVKEGGQFGKGYVYANKQIKTYDWFFTCHFYQDPVMPGSLGVEAIFQAMQTYAIQQNLAAGFKNPRFEQVANHKTNWKYRGQILLHVKEMQLEVHIKSVDMQNGQLVVLADAYLWNENIRIYHVTNVALGISEG